jgi:hypothetical protein
MRSNTFKRKKYSGPMADKLEVILTTLEGIPEEQWQRIESKEHGSTATYMLTHNTETYCLKTEQLQKKHFFKTVTVMAGKLEVKSSNGISAYGHIFNERLTALYTKIDSFYGSKKK